MTIQKKKDNGSDGGVGTNSATKKKAPTSTDLSDDLDSLIEEASELEKKETEKKGKHGGGKVRVCRICIDNGASIEAAKNCSSLGRQDCWLDVNGNFVEWAD